MRSSQTHTSFTQKLTVLLRYDADWNRAGQRCRNNEPFSLFPTRRHPSARFRARRRRQSLPEAWALDTVMLLLGCPKDMTRTCKLGELRAIPQRSWRCMHMAQMRHAARCLRQQHRSSAESWLQTKQGRARRIRNPTKKTPRPSQNNKEQACTRWQHHTSTPPSNSP